ncbi:MAG: DUF11 domain-containing protein, partial [Chloroflexi bacterium]|nr:DUF11 domain-containing protein [Chloroflexota bacterium]
MDVTTITWNVIGLDSNRVNDGPNKFPVGVRACNPVGSGATFTDVEADFVWLSGGTTNDDTYIKIRPGSLDPIPLSTNLAPGDCYDFYFEVEISRDSNAYEETRRYRIDVSYNDGAAQTVSTLTPRELFVEYLISQNRNATDNVYYGNVGDPIGSMTNVGAGGTMNLAVGQTYDIVLDAHTATQGYNQLESFINFPNTVFQIQEIQTNYTANSSTFVLNTNDLLYADACLWDNVITSDTYLECIGSDGKSGGTVTTRYTVKIISGVGNTEPLNTLLYDFSGSSFHYNADFETSLRFASITSSLSLSKSFSPKSITTSGGTSTLTLAIENSSASQMDNVSVSDPLPSGMKVALTPNSSQSAGCVSGTFSPSANDTTLSYSGSVAASGTCTLTVDVTASPDGSFTNTAELFLDGATTGITASDNLGVGTSAASCTTPSLLAQWTFPSAGVSITTAAPISSDAGSLISSASAYPAIASPGYSDTDASGVTTQAWRMSDFTKSSNAYIFEIPNGTNYSNLSIAVSYERITSNWTSEVFKIDSSTDGSTYAGIYSDNTTFLQNIWTTTSTPVNADQTGATNTYFKIYGTGDGNNARMAIDDVKIYGCPVVQKAELSKAFGTDPIKVGATSTLTFTLSNRNASTDLTSAEFTDILPDGMKVATTPNASTTCSGATWSPEADDKTLNFSGGTIPQGSPGTCTAQVDVTVNEAKTYTNTSGFIETNEGGINTNPYNDTKPGQGRDTLTATIGPPGIEKNFSPNPIAVNETSTITFTLTNPNSDVDLTGVAFSDSYPSNLVNAATPNASTTCGGTLTSDGTNPVAAADTSIDLAGATIPKGGSCVVYVDVTATATGDKVNTTGSISSSNGGTGNTATDTLGVNALTPALSLLKEVSTSASGPWSSSVNVSSGTDVYYRFTIENDGDVELSPIWVTDDTLSGASSCSWPATLPKDDIATCVVGPVTAGSSSSTNTATAKGKYSGTTYSSSTSSATYNITSLLLEKSVSPTTFAAGTSSLSYTYTITNNGAVAVSGTVTVNDTNATVTCSPATVTLNPTESTTCTATYTLLDRDRSIGYVTNVASASIGSAKTNTDSATSISDKPDLVVSKAADLSGGQAIQGTAFTWTVTVENNGGGTATFPNGGDVLSDTLPSGATYALPASYDDLSGLTNNFGDLSCSIASSTLTCTAADDDLVIESGKSFTVDVEITANVGTTSLTNTATVDPDGLITESNEGNNNGVDTVPASAPLPNIKITKTNDVSGTAYTNIQFTWTLTITNDGSSAITFNNNEEIVSDDLPAGPTYGSLTVTKTDVTNSANLSCSILSGTLTCKASGGSITIPATKSFVVEIPVTPTSAGSLSNTAIVNPDFLFSESSTADNSSTDSVTVTDVPDLDLSKTNGVTSVNAGGTTTYTLTVTNNGNSASSGTITVVDVLPSGLTYSGSTPFTPGGTDGTDWSCTVASDVITCTSVTAINSGGSTSVFAFTVNVDAGASGTQTNKAKVGGGGDPTNSSAPDSTTASACTADGTPEGCAIDESTTNNPPVNTVPGAQTVNTGVQTAISGVSVTDPNGNLATTQLTVPSGSL